MKLFLMDLSKTFGTINRHLKKVILPVYSFDTSLKFDLVTLETDFKG